MGDRRLDAVDTLVGQNIRIIRQDRGMSQTELGRKIDVTFQQVQKYENGTNRVGSGRLFKIASTFGMPITAFFEGTHETVNGDAGPSPVAMLAALCSTIAAGVLCRREPGPTALASRARRAPGQNSRFRAARLEPSARRERGPAQPSPAAARDSLPASADGFATCRGLFGRSACPNHEMRKRYMTGLGQFQRELGHVGQLRAETGLAGWRVTFRGGRVVTSPARVAAMR